MLTNVREWYLEVAPFRLYSRLSEAPWKCQLYEDERDQDSSLPHAILVLEGDFYASENNHCFTMPELKAIVRFLTLRTSKKRRKVFRDVSNAFPTWETHLIQPVSVAPVKLHIFLRPKTNIFNSFSWKIGIGIILLRQDAWKNISSPLRWYPFEHSVHSANELWKTCQSARTSGIILAV